MSIHKLPATQSRSQWNAVPTSFEVHTHHSSDGSKANAVRAIFGNTLVKIALGIVAGSAVTLAAVDKAPGLIDRIGQQAENTRKIDASRQVRLAEIEAKSHAADLKTQVQLARLEAVKAESLRKAEELKLETAKMQRDAALVSGIY